MIPVTDVDWTPLDFHTFKESDPQRYLLLSKEWLWVRFNTDRILKKSAKVYDLRCNHYILFINQVCLNYKQMEGLYREFHE